MVRLKPVGLSGLDALYARKVEVWEMEADSYGRIRCRWAVLGDTNRDDH